MNTQRNAGKYNVIPDRTPVFTRTDKVVMSVIFLITVTFWVILLGV